MITFLSYFLPFVPLILSVIFSCIELLIFKRIHVKAQRILLTIFYSLLFVAYVVCIILLSKYDIYHGWQRVAVIFGAWIYIIRNLIIKILAK